jgi:hypothetical protein
MTKSRPQRKVVTVYDRMQGGYRYSLVAPEGRGFHPEFRPELTPKEMLALGVFCGKYMTDCRKEFPTNWFSGAKLSPGRRDCSLNYFGLNASQPLSVWRKKGLDSSRRSARVVPVVLPLLHGAANAGRGCPSDQTMEGHSPPRGAGQTQLRARRSDLPPATAASLLHWAYDSRKI